MKNFIIGNMYWVQVTNHLKDYVNYVGRKGSFYVFQKGAIQYYLKECHLINAIPVSNGIAMIS